MDNYKWLTYDSFKEGKSVLKRSKNVDLCFWPCPHGQKEVVFDGYVKVSGGVKHLVSRYAKISITDAVSDVLQYGHFSSRPYRLGQACDGSINDCALALFERFCQEQGNSATALHKAAYPDEKRQRPHWREVVAAADWQGVAYPKRWNAKAIAGLLASLHEINYHSLASVVSDLVMKTEGKNCQ